MDPPDRLSGQQSIVQYFAGTLDVANDSNIDVEKPRRERLKPGQLVNCSECGQRKKHEAKGMCEACYKRIFCNPKEVKQRKQEAMKKIKAELWPDDELTAKVKNEMLDADELQPGTSKSFH